MTPSTIRRANRVLARLRLEKARAILAEDPDRAVKSIAYSLGFSSPAYFTFCFRRHYGCPPTEMR
jgi:AraC-like DNA-binding protein